MERERRGILEEGIMDLYITVSYTDKKENEFFLIYKENSDGISCKVEGLPNI
jgi:hypothetical protein